MSSTDPDPEEESDTESTPETEPTAHREGESIGPHDESRSEDASDESAEVIDPRVLIGQLRGLGERATRSYPTIIVVAIIVGVVLSPIVAAVASQGNSGTVAVIPLEGGIDGSSAAALAATLDRARDDPDIDAVVLVINSGGGSASASETMYLEISKTAEVMPVVSSVDSIAASGAYYAAVGSDRIFIKPASLAGNVGVLFTPPARVEPNDIILTTGPSKLAGASERGWRYKTDALQNAFLSAVVEGRGDALKIPRERVATAELFTGAEAVETGMADEIGVTRDAVEYAAAQAGLDSYDVTVLRPQEQSSFLTRTAYLASDSPNRTMVSVRYFVGEETGNQYPNFLMIPQGIVAEELAESSGAETTQPNGVSQTNVTERPPETPQAIAGSEVDDGY